MAANEFICDTVKATASSEDGRLVRLTVAAGREERHLTFPEIEISRVVSMLLVAGGDARRRSGNRNWRDLPLEKLTVAAPKDGSDDYRLLLRPFPEADPIVFRVQRKELIAMAEGILQSEGRRPVGQTSSTQ